MSTPLFDDLLNHIDLVDLVSKYVPLKRAGVNFSGCCPFHKEKTPSFVVSPQKQIFKCFGCGIGGNAFKFIQEIEKIDFRDAVKLLAEREHFDLSKYQINNNQSYKNDEKEKIKRMHKLAQQFFLSQLSEHPEVQQYLKEKRKLTDETITTFGLGYAPEGFSDLLTFLRSQGFTNTDLVQGSLAKQSSTGEYYSFFRNRVTFPIYDLMKNIVGFTARVLNPEDQPKYLNSAEHVAFEKNRILYGLSHSKPHIVQEKKIIIVEGQMDMIGLWRLGYPIGVATSGTALTDNHIKTIKRFTENVYLLFDNDQAGQQATLRALKLFYRQNLYPKMIALPTTSKDVDEVANLPEGKEIFSQCLAQATDAFLTLFERMRTQYDMNSPVDKQKLINTMFELILSIDNLTIQEHYKAQLAEKLGFPIEIIASQFKKYKLGEGKILLRQFQHPDESEKPPYTIDRDELFDALVYEDFIKQLLPEMETQSFVEEFYQFVTKLAHAIPESLVAQALSQQLAEEQKTEIRTLQLRWEKELGNSTDFHTKLSIIKKIIAPKVQEYFKMGTKSPSLSNEEKLQLNQMRIQLVK